MTVGYFVLFARNNAFANHRLLSACLQLQPGEFTAARTSFFPSIAHTVNHNLTVDWFYVDALEGGTLGYRAFEPEVPFTKAADVMREQRKVDLRLLDFCQSLRNEDLSRAVTVHRDEELQKERADRLLMHLFQHQIHHRGQAHAMLSGTSVKPPQLDEFFSAMDKVSRTPDLAALGWEEAELWSELP